MSPEDEREVKKPTAAAEFSFGIRARRTLLQTLFYATRNSSADAWAFHLRIERNNSVEKSFLTTLFDGLVQTFEKTVAEQTAQDAAWSLMLIVDYALRRLGDRIEPDTRDLGPVPLRGVRLSKLIWALANQARHLHEWEQLAISAPASLEENDSVKVIRSLQHDPLNANVAREVVAALPYGAYIDLEEAILAIADDASRFPGA